VYRRQPRLEKPILRRVALLSSLLLAACDDPLRLVVVETTQSDVATAGTAALGGSESGTGSGGRPDDGSGGTLSEGGTLSGGNAGADAGGSDAETGGDQGMAGMPALDPWDAPALFTASFASHAYPGQYMRHIGDKGFVAAIDMTSEIDEQDATFEMIQGLYTLDCDKHECVSFRSVNVNGGFFRHAESRIHLNPAHDDPLFLADATFWIEPGLADPQGISFRCSNYPARVIHLRNGNELWIDTVVEDAVFASEATFYLKPPLTESD
jgi:hypothetical protein